MAQNQFDWPGKDIALVAYSPILDYADVDWHDFVDGTYSDFVRHHTVVFDYVQHIGDVEMALGLELNLLGFHYCIAPVENCHIAVVASNA